MKAADAEAATTPPSTTRKRDAFSLVDEEEEEEDENVLFEVLNVDTTSKSEALSAAQQQQAEANRSVAELAALEAELGLEGEDFAVSSQLEMLGQDAAADVPPSPSADGGGGGVTAAAAAATTVSDTAGQTLEKGELPVASSSAAVLDDLGGEFDDIENMDLDKLLAGPGTEDGADDIDAGAADLTLDGAANELDDLDDFLASLDS